MGAEEITPRGESRNREDSTDAALAEERQGNIFKTIYSRKVAKHPVAEGSEVSQAVRQRIAAVTLKNGRRKMQKTTIGWRLLVRWKDGTKSWIDLNELKESHPIEVAEFA